MVLIINVDRYIVIKPYGKHLELLNDGIDVILACLHDVARTIKLAASNVILHRDIKPSNIVVYEGRGYLIDWGVAAEGSEVNNLSATLAYCSIKVWSFYHRNIFFPPKVNIRQLSSRFWSVCMAMVNVRMHLTMTSSHCSIPLWESLVMACWCGTMV